MTSAKTQRDALLQAADTDLLRLCRVDVFRGTGRGGQKRNRTESAVRITHVASGISATSDDTRSQHSNKRLALRRLRHEIALQWRCPPTDDAATSERPSQKSADYPIWLATILDLLAANTYRVAEAAEAVGCSTSRLVKELAQDPALWQTVNRGRTEHDLPPLRMPR